MTDFDGKTYARQDHPRLWTALKAVEHILKNGEWWPLSHLRLKLLGGYGLVVSEAGISARFRDLRKEKFGGYTMLSRRVSGGLWEYKMQLPDQMEMNLPSTVVV